MSSEVRQRKLNEQRKKIRDHQNKKHVQQLKLVQKNDNEIQNVINFSFCKEECSPLVRYVSNENSNSSKFAYDGPETFQLSNNSLITDNEIEIFHLNEIKISSTNKNEKVSQSNDVIKCDKSISVNCEIKSIESEAKTNPKSMKKDANDKIFADGHEKERDSSVQNQLNSNQSIKQSTEILECDLDSSGTVSHVAVAPCTFENSRSDIHSYQDNDSLEEEDRNGKQFHGFHETVLDSNTEIESFVTNPAPEESVVRCRITRDKHGMDKGMYPTYYLHLERKNNKPLFLLAARRRKLSTTSNYLISYDASDMKRDGFGFLAKLRSNFIGTHFTLYDNGRNPQSKINLTKAMRKELAAIIFETNVLGFKGPRKMTVIIPGMTPMKTPIDFQPKANEGDLLECCRTKKLDNLLELHNKKPMWNEDSQSYVLNFHGRVTQASVKNFQIIHENDAEYIIMQFGRTSDHSFSMDYAYPLSALQAFGIALSSFDGKLACE